MAKFQGRPQRKPIGSKRRRWKKGENDVPMWFSLEVAAAHAKTQQGVDIRERLLRSYDRPADA